MPARHPAYQLIRRPAQSGVKHLLTKSKYLSGLQCVKRLWLEEHAPQHLATGGATQEVSRLQGVQIGRLARARYSGGVLIGGAGLEAVRHTQAALYNGATCLFEAAFVYDDILVRCDILRKLPGGRWELIEVKSTTEIRPHHLHDAAVQTYVVRGAGLAVQAVKLMYVNSQGCVFPDLASFFCETDVTRAVTRLTRKLPANVSKLRGHLARPHAPQVLIGAHCSYPHLCPAKRYCWQHVPPESIFTIPRLSARKIARLLRRGIVRIRDIPAGFPLTPPQRAYVERVLAGAPAIDRPAIVRRLDELAYPIYFFDFETYAYAVPRFWGMRPYQQLPFQYSLHVLEADGSVRHADYLHIDGSDPRAGLAHALVSDIGPSGSVVVYNARFERSVLRDLAYTQPVYRQRLRSIGARLWDQLEIFERHYLDPRFEGSNSIKRVLPVLAPHLSYADLAVQRGDQAQAVWGEMIASHDPAHKAQLAAGLRAYCARDTRAMLEIHHALCRLVER
ncbi:MAG: DUF2779 domain-containing protein [Caldilineaceae bacterium]|nr:DUF2779 domain-containing protein [Caldilineaceae bacterium]